MGHDRMSGGQRFSNSSNGIKVMWQRLIVISLLALWWSVGSPAVAGATYTDNGDGTVTDSTTGLVWKHCGEGQTWSANKCSGQLAAYSWTAANALTNATTFAGHSDWRVPALSELQSIVAATIYTPTIMSINATAFPNQNTLFWSSTSDATTPSNGMYVSFIYGNTNSISKSTTLPVHLVRGVTTSSLAITQSLAQGWNLLGNNLGNTITVSSLYGDPEVVTTVWKWDSASATWQFYTPAKSADELLAYTQSKGYGLLSEIKPGEGYWVNAKTATTLPTQSGTPYSLSAADLAMGWNLVSTADDISPADLNRKLSDAPPGMNGTPNNFTTLWAWDGPSAKWYFYSPSLDAQGGTVLSDYIASKGYLDFNQANKTLGKGIGFWINKTGADLVIGNPSLGLTMTDAAGAAVTSVSNSSPAHVTATVLDANGAAVANTIVTFTVDPAFGAFSGGANTALTDASGKATVTLTTANTTGGASTVSASATVNGVAVTASLNYGIGTSVLTLSPITFSPDPPLSAYGTASVSVQVLNNGQPYTTPIAISFTSACAASGKATLTPSVTTVNGTATASYLDNGCNNSNPGDTVTATLMNGVTATGELKVSSPAIGSLQFVSVETNPVSTPPMITLKGTGGANKAEIAKVTFRVVDSAGNPVGNTLVNFSLNTGLGGLALTSTSAASDPATGNVVTYVQAGTMSTSVRVTASTGTLSTQSDQLFVSTGVPSQDSISLSASTHNIEGWAYDGITTDLTVRLADHFHNPVLDGTAVYFTSEGGAVTSACLTANNQCTVKFTSQALRPTNGRITVLARTTGDEAFTDLNSNGTVDSAEEMIDANGDSTDIGEAYLDYNEDGIWDPTKEPFYDFNGNGVFDGTTLGGAVGSTSSGDGKYHGLLCTPGAAICSPQKSIDVRASIVIILSTSTPAPIIINGGAPITLLSTDPPQTFTVTVVDQHGNAMPAGTKVTFATTNGEIVAGGDDYVVPDSTGCRPGYSDCPASAQSPTFGNLPITMQSSVDGVNSGLFTVTVTTPNGTITKRSMAVTDDQ
jgi:hypothetical protein